MDIAEVHWLSRRGINTVWLHEVAIDINVESRLLRRWVVIDDYLWVLVQLCIDELTLVLLQLITRLLP